MFENRLNAELSYCLFDGLISTDCVCLFPFMLPPRD